MTTEPINAISNASDLPITLDINIDIPNVIYVSRHDNGGKVNIKLAFKVTLNKNGQNKSKECDDIHDCCHKLFVETFTKKLIIAYGTIPLEHIERKIIKFCRVIANNSADHVMAAYYLTQIDPNPLIIMNSYTIAFL